MLQQQQALRVLIIQREMELLERLTKGVENSAPTPVKLSEADIDKLAAKLFVFGFDGKGTEPAAHARRLIDKGFGGVILFARNIENPKQVAELCANLKLEAADRPLLIMIDQEGGRVARLGPPFSKIPAARVLSEASKPEVAAASAGKILGRELRAVNIDLDAAPVMDVDTNPDNPVIGSRSFSRSPEVVAAMGCSLIREMQRQGVAACAKHFPGHGDTSKDSHLELPTLAHDLPRLQQVELPPFQAAADAGVAAIMLAHVTVPALDRRAGVPAPGALPASMSAGALRYLRRDIGYDGVAITDDLEMGALKEWGIEKVVVSGLSAGVDMFLVCHTEEVQLRAHRAVVEAVLTGAVSQARLLEAARRVDTLMADFVRPPTTKLHIVGSRDHAAAVANILAASKVMRGKGEPAEEADPTDYRR
eukprot:CAMPEP_0118937618 /NCGR_PEP_ID=MMETSP1169-20130426/23279_1 /TAXON_ID=36882 /ORGANISM="Pyramimonas obovata, Strain CCMP722" /LENGTH=420 /DNA_ID=CAMNT_0006881301 /DNA_START=82 /DNA_END=1345 /DNA_ORIENTATION=-